MTAWQDPAMHERAAVVAEALRRGGAPGTVRELADSTRTAVEAAAALGCAVGAIVKSLVFLADDEPVLVLVSGADRVDLTRLRRALPATEVRRANPDEVRTATGQVIGGVAPLGHPEPLRCLIDPGLGAFETIWAAAGTPHAVFPTSFPELTRLAGATVSSIAADG